MGSNQDKTRQIRPRQVSPNNQNKRKNLIEIDNMHSNQGGRPRGKSSAENDLLSGDISMEDLTVMKLMEEIMEFDQEIKMKQQWINTRMKMLHKLLPAHQGSRTANLIEKFMSSLQPEYPKKISVTYERQGSDAIPMPMDSGNPIAMPQADVFEQPIQMSD